MKKAIGVVLLVLVGSTLAYCFVGLPTYSWHQKMIVEVQVDEQVYAGSSVIRVRWRKNDPIGAVNGPDWISGVQGEVPIVELPKRGMLFALLSDSSNSSYAADLATQILSGRNGWARGNEEFAVVQEAQGQTLTIPPDRYPFMVTFTDITDPTTVKQVDPTNLAATFGPGVSLKRITLAITDEPVTEGKIEQVLGWWNNLTVPIGGKENRKYGDPLYGIGKWNFVRK
jgi:hypothetical protein